VQDIGKLLLRVTLAALILFHGVDKIIHGIVWMQDPLASLGLPSWIAYGVYIGEVIAPLFLILGLGARIAALVIAINMVMAVILDAHKLAFTINGGGGWGLELEAFYFMSAVTLILLGPGRFRLFANARPAAVPGAGQANSP
jgi:putative oxidoreductase